MAHLQVGLRPETVEKARLELSESPETIHQAIQEVRDLIITRPDVGFLRTDDVFILRFLRARKSQPAAAFRLLAQYFDFRQQNLEMFKNFKATDHGIKQALRDGFPGVLSQLDHHGRKVLVLFAANWDQSRYTFVDILRAILLSLEMMIEDPELQVNGFVLIIDWSNFSFKQASRLSPSMLRLAIEGLQIFLHGNNLTSLHQLIQPEILPSEFGGLEPPYDMGTWARTLLGPDYDDDTDGRYGGGFFDGRRASERLVPTSTTPNDSCSSDSPRNCVRRLVLLRVFSNHFKCSDENLDNVFEFETKSLLCKHNDKLSCKDLPKKSSRTCAHSYK
uniref:Clavesin-2 n=1 Tax=Eptatretus burgeri TaxID=7764 RepID=A0A8C4Q801_EPTBU